MGGIRMGDEITKPNRPAGPTVRKVKGYGWKRDLPDHRDHFYTVPAPVQVPRKVDLSPQCPPVFDQGQLGSCVSNAVTALFQFDEMRQKEDDASQPNSRLFLYYNARSLEDAVGYDAGATIRDGIRAVAAYGSVKESAWPYDIEKFTVRPTDEVFSQARKDIITEYRRIVQKIADLRACLASGNPFAFGFTVYQSFESQEVAQTGNASMPGWFDRAIGGHAVMAVGYNDDTKRFLVRNSWGNKWGLPDNPGYFTIPMEYLLNPDLAGDFWTIASVPT